jgi:hypothetical protein
MLMKAGAATPPCLFAHSVASHPDMLAVSSSLVFQGVLFPAQLPAVTAVVSSLKLLESSRLNTSKMLTLSRKWSEWPQDDPGSVCGSNRLTLKWNEWPGQAGGCGECV